MKSTASWTFWIFSASSSEISIPNSSSRLMINSTRSSESAFRSSTNEACGLTSSSSTPSCSTMIFLSRSYVVPSLTVSLLYLMLPQCCGGRRSRGGGPLPRRMSRRGRLRRESSPWSRSRRSIASPTRRSGGSCAQPDRARSLELRGRTLRSRRRAPPPAPAPRPKIRPPRRPGAAPARSSPPWGGTRPRRVRAWPDVAPGTRGRHARCAEGGTPSCSADRPRPGYQRLGTVGDHIGRVTARQCGVVLGPRPDEVRDAFRGRLGRNPDGVLHHAGAGPTVGHDAHAANAQQRRPAVLRTVKALLHAIKTRLEREERERRHGSLLEVRPQ